MLTKLTKILYHLLSVLHVILIKFIPTVFYKIVNNNLIIFITPYAIQYDGRVRRSVDMLLTKGFNVELIKPQDCLDDNISSWHPNLTIVPLGYSRSYTYFPYVFDLKVMNYLLKSKASQIYCRDIYSGIMGVIIGLKTHKKITIDFYEWVSETKDYNYKTSTTCTKPQWKKKLFKYYERYICIKADRLITNNLSFAEGIAQKKVSTNKFNIIRNIPKVKPINPELNLRKFLPNKYSNKKILYYVGQLSFDRKLDTIIIGMQHIENCILLIQGTGHINIQLKYQNLLDKYNLNHKIIFLPPVLGEEIVSYASTADVGIFICDTEDNKMYHALPNKLFEYVLAEIPQLSCQGVEIEKIFRRYKIGLIFDAYDSYSFYQQVTKILSPQVYNLIKQSVLKYKQQVIKRDDFEDI